MQTIQNDTFTVGSVKNAGSQALTTVSVDAARVPIQELYPNIFVQSWESEQKADANYFGKDRVALIVHGLGEHGGRYAHFPKYLGRAFERFYAMDQRGHGRSSGLRGYSPVFQLLVEDLKRVISELAEREKGKKLYLIAHSFGGLVALKYLLTEKKVPFVSAVISAPLLAVAMRVPPLKIWLGQVLGRTLPRVQLSNEVNPSHLSHDPMIVEAYVKDRLVHSKITPKLYLEMAEAMNWVGSHYGPLACPTLFVVPGQDKVVDSQKTLSFYRGLKDRHKELREYPSFYHESFNETEKQLVFADVEQWFRKEWV